MDNFQLVVGDEACPIHHVISIIGEDAIILERWSDFARELAIPSSKIKKLRKDMQLDKIELSDAISDVMEDWVAERGNGATLSVLLGVIEDNLGATAVGELLRLRFNLPCRRNKALLEWKDLSSGFQKRVNQTLQHFFPKLEFGKVLAKLEGPLLDDLMMGRKPPIFKQTLPERLSYYIHRKLITQHFTSNNIFDDQSPDIFLFTGMDRSELSKLAKDKATSTTKEQLRRDGVNSKFITLDHVNHFDRICTKTPNPVHLLRKESEGRLKWIRSRGQMGNLRKHIDASQNEIDEVAFCNQVDAQFKAVIISDSPGMGKSVLLGEIGRNLEETYPGRSVHFIVLSEFIVLIRELGKESKNLPEVLTKALQASICENVLGEVVVPSEINSEEDSISTELLLDGLDEVRSSDSEFALEVLRRIRDSFKSVRFWVTSRPHLLEHLEDNLSSLGYNIRPFNQDSQVQFLSSYWQRSPSVKIDQVRSVEFADHCLLSLESTLTSSDEDIAGVPLQCLLVGQIYEEEAMEYAGLDNEPLAAIEVEVETIANLYRLLVQKKFQKYVTAFPGTKLDIPDLMDIHVRLSLKLIFPESVERLGETSGPVEDDIIHLEEVLNVGILERSSTAVAPRFLHRTFAEYFVAWFVLEKLRNERAWKVELREFFFKSVMGCQMKKINDFTSELVRVLWYGEFNNPVICYFLNSFISELSIKSLPSLASEELLSFDIMRGITFACTNPQFVKIFMFFDDLKAFDQHSRQLFDSHFLRSTLKWSSVEMLRRVFMHFDRSHKFDLELQSEVLKRAVERGQFSIVEFLLKEMGLRGIVEEMKGGTRELLHDCVRSTRFRSRSNKVIEEIVLIVRMLVEINPDLLEAKDENGNTPLLCDYVNVHLLKELIRLGANVMAQDMENFTVLHSTVYLDLTPGDYHSLLISIPTEKLEKLVHVKCKAGYTPMTNHLQYFELLPGTLHTFHTMGADFNAVDDKGYSVLATAIKSGKKSETIRILVKLGASLCWRGIEKGETLLHLAAKFGNVEAVEILLQELEFKVNVKDKVGLTSLEYAIRSSGINNSFAGMMLIKQGATFSEDRNSECLSLLHIAANSANMDSVKLLLHLGVDVNASDELGNTPLHLITGHNYRYRYLNETTVIELLLQHSADPRAVNSIGETPFHNALKDMSLGEFDFLKSKTAVPWSPSLANLALYFITHCSRILDDEKFHYFARECEAHGADFNFVKEDGDSLLHITLKSEFLGHHELRSITYLVKNGANPNLTNKLGRTPLHLAALSPYSKLRYPIIAMLIKTGADTHAKDKEGKSFIDYILAGLMSPSEFHLVVEYLSSSCQIGRFSSIAALQGNDFNLLHHAVDKFDDLVVLFAIHNLRGSGFLNAFVNELKVKLDSYWYCLLHNAAQYGTLDCLKFLLDLGGLNVNQAFYCETPLHYAVQQGSKEHMLEKCKLLIERGADRSVLNWDDQTPLGIFQERIYENHKNPLPEGAPPPLQLTDGEIDELIQLLSPSSQNSVS